MMTTYSAGRHIGSPLQKSPVGRYRLSRGRLKVRVKRPPRLQNAINQMQELAHDGGNDGHLTQATVQQALGKSAQNGIVAFGNDGGQVQGGTNGRVASLGQGGF